MVSRLVYSLANLNALGCQELLGIISESISLPEKFIMPLFYQDK